MNNKKQKEILQVLAGIKYEEKVELLKWALDEVERKKPTYEMSINEGIKPIYFINDFTLIKPNKLTDGFTILNIDNLNKLESLMKLISNKLVNEQKECDNFTVVDCTDINSGLNPKTSLFLNTIKSTTIRPDFIDVINDINDEYGHSIFISYNDYIVGVVSKDINNEAVSTKIFSAADLHGSNNKLMVFLENSNVYNYLLVNPVNKLSRILNSLLPIDDKLLNVISALDLSELSLSDYINIITKNSKAYYLLPADYMNSQISDLLEYDYDCKVQLKDIAPEFITRNLALTYLFRTNLECYKFIPEKFIDEELLIEIIAFIHNYKDREKRYSLLEDIINYTHVSKLTPKVKIMIEGMNARLTRKW